MVKIYKIIFVLSLLFLGSVPFRAHAATLSFSGASQAYTIGQTFTVQVSVSSLGQAMNASSGVVSFPADKLQVVSVSKVGSVFSLWVQEPAFSNISGNISFEGIVLNPGFIGSNGKIMSVTFRAIKEGQGSLSFSSGSVLANDGSGTNILSNSYSSLVTIGAKQVLQEEETPKIEDVKSSGQKAPIVTSPTHPDQAKWYSNNTPEFTWNVPDGVLEVRTLIGTNPTSIPTITYNPPIGNRKANPLQDGTYYFHVQMRTASGWGEVAHYRVNIDTTAPKSFTVSFPDGSSGLNPRPVISFGTIDALSGIDSYDIKIDGKGGEKVLGSAPTVSHLIPSQIPGEHTLVVTAFDFAGNKTSASAEFTINALESPIITSYPKEIVSGDLIKIAGVTYPNADVTIWFKKEDGTLLSEERSRSNASGEFSLITEKKMDGNVYMVTARVVDQTGAQSHETSPLAIVVHAQFLQRITTFLLDYLSAVLLIILALGLIGIVGALIWYKLIRVVVGLERKNKQVEALLKKSFTALRADIDKHIAKLKTIKAKRELTDEEIAFLERFEKNIVTSETLIEKELKSEIAPKKRKPRTKKVTLGQ